MVGAVGKFLDFPNMTEYNGPKPYDRKPHYVPAHGNRKVICTDFVVRVLVGNVDKIFRVLDNGEQAYRTGYVYVGDSGKVRGIAENVLGRYVFWPDDEDAIPHDFSFFVWLGTVKVNNGIEGTLKNVPWDY